MGCLTKRISAKDNPRCDCDDYHSSLPQLSSAQTLAWAHGWRYTGAFWKYCPWCGKKFKPLKVKTKLTGKPV